MTSMLCQDFASIPRIMVSIKKNGTRHDLDIRTGGKADDVLVGIQSVLGGSLS